MAAAAVACLQPLRRTLRRLEAVAIRDVEAEEHVREALLRKHHDREEGAAVAARIAAEWMFEL